MERFYENLSFVNEQLKIRYQELAALPSEERPLYLHPYLKDLYPGMELHIFNTSEAMIAFENKEENQIIPKSYRKGLRLAASGELIKFANTVLQLFEGKLLPLVDPISGRLILKDALLAGKNYWALKIDSSDLQIGTRLLGQERIYYYAKRLTETEDFGYNPQTIN